MICLYMEDRHTTTERDFFFQYSPKLSVTKRTGSCPGAIRIGGFCWRLASTSLGIKFDMFSPRCLFNSSSV